MGLQAVSLPLRDCQLTPPPDLLARVQAAVSEVTPEPVLDCEEALQLASAAADGEVTLEELRRLQVHRDGCAACDRAAREMLRVAGLLRDVSPEPVPLGLLSRVQEAVGRTQPRPQRRWNLTRVLAVGAAAAAVWLAIVLGPLSQSQVPGTEVALTPPAPVVRSAQPAPAVVSETPSQQPVVASRPTVQPAARVVPPVSAPEATAPPQASRPAVAPTAVQPRPAATSPVTRPAPAAGEHLAVEPPPVGTTDFPGRAGKTPVAVAARPASETRSRDLSPALQPETAVVVTPRLAGVADKPTPGTPVASLESAKASPAADTLTPPRPSLERQRSNWVSRPAEEREIYSSEGLAPKLALAQRNLDKDLRHITAKPAEWVIH
jgi:bacterioferritin-associated ferredoxin